MDEVTKILGRYYLKEQDHPDFANEFILDLYKKDGKIRFNLEMVTLGNFGKVGRNWIGIGIFRADHFVLIIERELDWAMAKEDKEKTVNESQNVETLPIEIYPMDKEIIVYHRKIERQLHLKKIKSF